MTAQLHVLTTEDNDSPTAKIENLSGRILSALVAIDRLAELAKEKIEAEPDEFALESAVADIENIRVLVRAVQR